MFYVCFLYNDTIKDFDIFGSGAFLYQQKINFQKLVAIERSGANVTALTINGSINDYYTHNINKSRAIDDVS